MTIKKAKSLKRVDPEHFHDLLIKTEQSFGITFTREELVSLKTFGQLSDLIIHKMTLDNADDCTAQQAFYKLRHAFAVALQINDKSIGPDDLLSEVLRGHNRRSTVIAVEKHLGFKLNILKPQKSLLWIMGIIDVVAYAALFYYWNLAFLGLAVAWAGVWLVKKYGADPGKQTFGDVAAKMTWEHYLKSRRNPATYNRTEIGKILVDWFAKELRLDKSMLTRDAVIV
jgi:hypothetical protein